MSDHFDRKAHWEKIYSTKQVNEVSWYQPTPETSLHFIQQFKLPFNAKIIDVGGGNSFFVDHLLERGYEDITVLDISEHALNSAKERLGEKAALVKWIVSDASKFIPNEKYDFWHDRAAFHFLTQESEIENYLNTAKKTINKDGVLVLATFSENGPKKCSGIEIKQYSEKAMNELLQDSFIPINSITIDHKTPFDTIQNFIFCCFRKQ